MLLMTIVSAASLGALLGYRCHRYWYNHFTIYSVIWGTSLGLYSIRLIDYHTIATEAWLLIIGAWVSLFLGSAVVLSARALAAPGRSNLRYFGGVRENNAEALTTWIVVLSMLSLVADLPRWMQLLSLYSGPHEMLAHANAIYHSKLRGELVAGIPVIGSGVHVASVLSGYAAANRGRMSVTNWTPLFFAGLHSLVTMGRTTIVLATVLFVSGFLLGRGSLKRRRVVREFVVPVIVLGLGTVLLISGTRKLSGSGSLRFAHESPRMDTLREYVSFAPSLYFVISGQPVVFSEYLKAGGEKARFGENTFAPLINGLARFGLVERVPPYQQVYLTPEPMNTGTYLRELHADFGVMGVIVFPLFLGALIAYLDIRGRPRTRYDVLRVLLGAHAYSVVVMSFDMLATRWGEWFVSLIMSVMLGLYLAWRANGRRARLRWGIVNRERAS